MRDQKEASKGGTGVIPFEVFLNFLYLVFQKQFLDVAFACPKPVFDLMTINLLCSYTISSLPWMQVNIRYFILITPSKCFQGFSVSGDKYFITTDTKIPDRA